MLRHDLKLRRAVYKEGTLPVSLAYHDLGELRERAGDLDEAADLYRKAYEIRKIARGEQGKETAKSRAALIHVLREQHKVAEAAQLERAGTSPAPTSSPARP
jgi:tetratricopeptide (TPR) repeat protein